MAKPRRVVLPEGTVLLAGFPKDIANELEAYVAKFKKSEMVVAAPVMNPSVDEVEEPVKLYPYKAVGLREKNPGQWEVVIVGYDDEEAGIEEIKNAGDFKAHAISVFQQEVFKRGLV